MNYIPLMKWLNDQIYPNNSTFLAGHNNAIKKVMVKLRTNNNCVLCEEAGRHKIPNGNLVCDNHRNMLVDSLVYLKLLKSLTNIP
jgi:hypothetical protein